MAAAACCWVSGIPNQVRHAPHLVASAPNFSTRSTVAPAAVPVTKAILREEAASEKECIKRRSILAGVGTLASGLVLPRITSAEVVPEKFRAFVDFTDGYSYYYPSDWRDFDFIGCDSAFKDRNVALQHVRVSFIPTDKGDIRDLGPMEEVIPDLVKNVYAAPTQKPTIFDMLERNLDGKNYWTFEYELQSPNFGRTAFATIAIGNGRYYTLIVGANERRWRRVRSQLKTIADSFRMLDI